MRWRIKICVLLLGVCGTSHFMAQSTAAESSPCEKLRTVNREAEDLLRYLSLVTDQSVIAVEAVANAYPRDKTAAVRQAIEEYKILAASQKNDYLTRERFLLAGYALTRLDDYLGNEWKFYSPGGVGAVPRAYQSLLLASAGLAYINSGRWDEVAANLRRVRGSCSEMNTRLVGDAAARKDTQALQKLLKDQGTALQEEMKSSLLLARVSALSTDLPTQSAKVIFLLPSLGAICRKAGLPLAAPPSPETYKDLATLESTFNSLKPK